MRAVHAALGLVARQLDAASNPMRRSVASRSSADKAKMSFSRGAARRVPIRASLSPETAENVVMQISGVIKFGAPMYNKGDARGCARLYRQTALSIARDASVTSEEIRSCLRDAVAKADEIARKAAEDAETGKRKRDETTVIEPWDVAYFSDLLKREELAFDDEKVKEFFPLETTIDGLLETYSTMLGLSFERSAELPRWHEEVSAFVVKRGADVVGHLYLDQFPREGKFGHQMVVPLAPSFVDSADGVRCVPAACNISNLPRPLGDAPAHRAPAVRLGGELVHVLALEQLALEVELLALAQHVGRLLPPERDELVGRQQRFLVGSSRAALVQTKLVRVNPPLQQQLAQQLGPGEA